MGFFENLKEMELKKLRIIVMSLVVATFVLALVLFKIGAEKLGLNKGEYFPLLVNKNRNSIVTINGTDIDKINKYLGKRMAVVDKVKSVTYLEREKKWILKLSYLSIPLNEKLYENLMKKGVDIKDLEGITIKALGTIHFHPVLGLELIPDNNSNIEILQGKVGR
ncbi:hypothetical protein TST_1552 [Thermosulfidibacter takaii ABI70S6]|uniref:Uncharacterized protein n=1 Tax=Thermosulfidibacter takaii (strain DSM 17441 / JCM 13301 / NBRC 103674 / ABI70S6) TaxID=1298851 RepID=A0A0S3QVI6_THET7|nr:hypothetical protein [Thermosulfidibacter takaii]BAT72338.1 hypothetical protein TST_1552 [Thermosulfidibacter takaii ABI70S6]